MISWERRHLAGLAALYLTLSCLAGCSHSEPVQTPPLKVVSTTPGATGGGDPAGKAMADAASHVGNSALTPDNTAPQAQEDAPMTEGRIGIKFYPGARVVTGGETPELISANLETTVSIQKVVEFYQRETPQLVLSGDPSNAMFEGEIEGKKTVLSAMPTNGGGTAISIIVRK